MIYWECCPSGRSQRLCPPSSEFFTEFSCHWLADKCQSYYLWVYAFGIRRCDGSQPSSLKQTLPSLSDVTLIFIHLGISWHCLKPTQASETNTIFIILIKLDALSLNLHHISLLLLHPARRPIVSPSICSTTSRPVAFLASGFLSSSLASFYLLNSTLLISQFCYSIRPRDIWLVFI